MYNKKWAATQNTQNSFQTPIQVQQQNIQTQNQYNNTNGLIKKNGCNCNKKKPY